MRDIEFRAWDTNAKCFITIEQLRNVFFRILDGNYHERFVLQQYTGLKDKNGQRIYEGDIVGTNSPTWKYRVDWENGSFWLNHLIISKTFSAKKVDIRRVKDFEVIGNIYENKKLLKKE